jgi:hypothetical protein
MEYRFVERVFIGQIEANCNFFGFFKPVQSWLTEGVVDG